MQKELLKVALIGVGSVGKKYARMITAGEVPHMKLSAVVIRRDELIEWGESLVNTDGDNARIFRSAEELFETGESCYDAVIIATPHKTHKELALKAFAKGKAFIPFITCGDPDLGTTKEIVKVMVDNGADLVELGIPFSDPTAEGPVIQGANLRALKGGVTTDKIFDMVAELPKEVTVPMVFMTYANVVYSYGIERFAKRAAEVGMDGLILPDVPFEEKEEFAPAFREQGMDLISLIAPTSHERIAMIAKEAEGFVYCVSSLGVTGMRNVITTDVGAMVKLVKEASDIPAAIGFGISNPEQAANMAEKSDGVIVGSAIVKLVEKYGKEAPSHVAEFVKSMKDAVREK